MTTLPPYGYLAPAHAALYTIGFLLKENSLNNKHRLNPQSVLYNVSDIYGEFLSIRNSSTDFMPYIFDVKHIYLNTDPDSPLDFSSISGIVLVMNARKITEATIEGIQAGASIEPPPKELNNLLLNLEPPYKNLFERGRYFTFDEKLGYSKLPLCYAILNTPNIGKLAMLWLRHSLANEKIQSCFVCEDGNILTVPGNYWRSERSSYIFDFHAPTAIEIEDKCYFGRFYLDFITLQKDLVSAAEASTSNLSTNSTQDLKLGPYLSFMIEASKALNLINGMQKDGQRLAKKEIEQWLKENWPSGLGEASKALIENMATLLRHPDAAKGGNLKGSGLPTQLHLEDKSSAQ